MADIGSIRVRLELDAEGLLEQMRRALCDVDVLRPGGICAHCGFQMRGSANVDGRDVCHTDAPFPDCYRLITAYGDALGSRRPGGSS